MQIQIKKQRGRSANHQQHSYSQINRKDRKPQVSGEGEGPYRAEGGESSKTALIGRHGFTSSCSNQKNKDIMNSSERYEQANIMNNTIDNKIFRDSQIGLNKLGAQSHQRDARLGDKDASTKCSNFENKLDQGQ